MSLITDLSYRVFLYIYTQKTIMSLPKPIKKLVEYLSELSGIGEKTALRLALEIIRKEEIYAYNFAQAMINAKQELKECKTCNNISENEICHICSNTERNHKVICIVEEYQDVLAIENTGSYNGVYHILGGLISPINGIGPSQLNIESLLNRIQNNNIDEIIMALNSTMEGESTAFYLYKKIQSIADIPVSTLAKGIAVGEDLNYADELSLSRSILHRVPLKL